MMSTKSIKVSIAIPTLKDPKKIQGQIYEINKYPPSCDYEVIASCINQSAAKNRNWCIDSATGDIIIMCDDDITGYFPGWADLLIDSLFFNSNFSIASARPLKPNGGLAPILGDNSQAPESVEYQKCIHTTETGLNICGSATIAFWRKGCPMFDENYVGATYEDSDFCMSMKQKYPEKDIIFVNKCNIIHNEERKGRGPKAGDRTWWRHNHDYFANKWGVRI
jgi:glycosyltransferase involved in cell wall biosynthesis